MAAGGGGSGKSGAIRTGAAFVEIFAKDAGLRRFLNNIPKQFKALGKQLSAIGLYGAGIGIAIAAPLAGLVNYFVDAGSAATDMAARLNTTTETITSLAYAADLAGTSAEDMEGALAKLQKQIAAGEDVAGFDLSAVKDADLETQVYAVADAIAAIENPTLQAAAATEAFGKSGRKMLPFLKEGAAGLAKLKAQAGRDGAIITSKDAEHADRVGDALSRVWTVIKSIARAVGAGLLPSAEQMEGFANRISSAGAAVRAFIGQNSELLRLIGLVAAGLTAGGLALAGLGVVFSSVAAIVGTLAAAVAFILTPFGALTVGFGALAVATVDAMAQAGAFADLINTLGVVFGDTWGGIQDALAGGDLQLAFEIAGAGIEVAWDKLTTKLTSLWHKFLDGLSDMARSWAIALAEDSWLADVGAWLVGDSEFRKGEVKRGTRDPAQATISPQPGATTDAEDRLEDKRREAARKRDWEDARRGNLDAITSGKLATIAAAQQMLQEGTGPVQGAFGGQASSGALGLGDGSGIEKNTERTAKACEGTEKAIKGLKPVLMEE